MNSLDSTDEAPIARVAKAILVELGHVSPPTVAPLDPEVRISDPDARRQLYGNCSRTKFWQLMKDADAPASVIVGKTRLRKVRDHLAFLAKRAAT